MKKTLFFILILGAIDYHLLATDNTDIRDYKSTDNLGLSKVERIDKVESYLSEISKNLKNLKSRLEDFEKKMGILDTSVSVLKKDFQTTRLDFNDFVKTGSKKTTKDPAPKAAEGDKANTTALSEEELLKLKEDFDKFRGADFDELKKELKNLRARFEELQLNASLKKN